MTIQEAFEHILHDDAARTAYREAAERGAAGDYIRSMGVEASDDEISACLKSLVCQQQGAIDDDSLAAVAGGANGYEAFLSVLTIGLGCAGVAVYSALGNVPKEDYPDGRLLCDAISV